MVESTPIRPGGPEVPRPAGEKTSESGQFKKMLQGYLEEVDQLQKEADKAVFDLASGKLESLHQVVAAVNEADLSFRLMMAIRNKLLEAYKEIIRMQV